MEWIVKIEDNDKQRVRITFNPMLELITFFGEVKLKGNEWTVFSQADNEMNISLEDITFNIEKVIIIMRDRLDAYQNIDEGFCVIKLIGFAEPED